MVMVVLLAHTDGLQWDPAGAAVHLKGFWVIWPCVGRRASSEHLRKKLAPKPHHLPALQIYDAAEIFSGRGILSECLREAGMAVASLDVVYWEDFAEQRSKKGRPVSCRNPLDLTTSAGFASPF